jgi:hypothetical protein
MRNDDEVLNAKLLRVKARVLQHFNQEQWHDIGLLTNSVDVVSNHHRLLRSLSFGDDDYGGHAISVLRQIIDNDPANLGKIELYLDEHFGDDSTYVSSVASVRRITFAPNVFKVPDVEVRQDLVGVMMPFEGFDPVFLAIKKASGAAGLECLRADDLWEECTFMQDVFNLIFKSRIVISDFSTKNPNVMYETGLAHCLGRTVVPIAQHIGDIPSDLRHHRVCIYLPNSQGLSVLEAELTKRLRTLIS